MKIYVPIFCRKYSCRSRRTSSNSPPPGFDSIISMRRGGRLCSQRRSELQGDDGLGIVDLAFKNRLPRFDQVNPERFDFLAGVGGRGPFRYPLGEKKMDLFIAKARGA